MICDKCGYMKSTPTSKCFCGGKIKTKKKKSTGEFNMFMEIALERSINGNVNCVKCGKVISLQTLTVGNFDHIIPKSKGEQYRLDKTNISILCFACHFEKTNGLKLKTNYLN